VLKDKGNAGTPLGRATRRHESLALQALTELALIEAMGGYVDYCAVPMPKLHLYALALSGRAEAQEAQMKDANKGASGSSDGVGGPGWRQRNKTTGEWEG
jgi:hypothetical protein